VWRSAGRQRLDFGVAGGVAIQVELHAASFVGSSECDST
jgi:hypothetical protein